MEDASVHAVVVVLGRRSEYLGLHTRPDYPEGIRNDVAKEAADASRGSIESERLVPPAIPFLETQLCLLVEREVDRVEQWDAKH